MKYHIDIKYVCWLGAVVLGTIGCNRSSEPATGGTSDSSQTTSSSSAGVADRTPGNGSAALPDNTGKNVRDRSDTTLTSGDQGESPADLELTRRIRRAVTSNSQLSTEAKNIKIITSNGKVTLRGPVQSEQERQTIGAMAQQISGGAVDDQLEVKTTNR